MNSNTNFLVAGMQYSLPNGAVITLDSKIAPPDAFLLTGLLPQNTMFRLQRIGSNHKIHIENKGDIPAIWFELDNPQKPTIVKRTLLNPGDKLFVSGLFTMGFAFLAFDAFSASPNYISHEYFPYLVRVGIQIAVDGLFRLTYI